MSVNSIRSGQKKFSPIKSLKALAAGTIIQLSAIPFNELSMAGAQKLSKKLTPEQIKTVNLGADKIISDLTNLGSKGVKIINYTDSHASCAPDSSFLNKYSNALETTAQGKNAFFSPLEGPFGVVKNSVHINQDKYSLAVFHELGHAYNFNNSAIFKNLQTLGGIGKIVSALAFLIPVFTKDSKPKEGQELTKAQKFKNALRKYSPLIALGAMVPTLLEEAAASIRGCRWAKQVLNKDLYKATVKTNIIAYFSYLIGAIIIALSTLAAKKIKDEAQKNKEI